MKLKFFSFVLAVSFFGAAAVWAQINSPHEKLLMDAGWKFHLGDNWPDAIHLDKAGASSGPAAAAFSDKGWRTVNLPHDWAVELPFDPNADGSHGFHPVGPGFADNNTGWYRRKFLLPADDSDKRIWLDFDGVFRDATVFVNGWIVGRHESGYSSFRYDITDAARFGGANVVAVRVDASKFEGWFYEGAGIYRHVWLEKTAPVAIAPDGIFVWSEFKNNVPKGQPEIHAETTLLNRLTNSVIAKVNCEIVSPDGKSVAKFGNGETIRADAEKNLKLQRKISSPVLWSPEHPNLYKLVTTVSVAGKLVDRQETAFGIRTLAFDANKGFLLNGQPYFLKGTCNHQDHAGVGAALPDALQNFRVGKLEEFGCNAIRTSHNLPTAELLDACDRLGMIVMDENRLLGGDAQNLARLRDQIFRDRNHPSVCIWSIANEEFSVQDTPQGVRAATTMQNLVKRLDPTRPVTYAAPVGDVFSNNINSVIEVRGWNYHVGPDMDNYHREHPLQPQVGTEQGSAVSTRGIYANDKQRGYVSAYDVNAPSWATTSERWMSYFAERPWLSGGFVWTGFDYRGEPTPYSWPCINSHFGILDTCGFPKDNYYYYQSAWTDKPMVHLLPHWNWPGKEGQDVSVWVYSNCKAVELFLNGQSLGRQDMPKNLHLEWKVEYAPGTLSAKGYDAQGKVLAETKVETTGDPAAIQLMPDRATINADGEDVSVVAVAVADAQGRIVPLSSNNIHFSLDGPGQIIGVGNGDPSCHEPDKFFALAPFRERPVDGWRWNGISNAEIPDLPEMAADFDDSGWQNANVKSSSGPLEPNTSAAFRTKIDLAARDLDAESVELNFGCIDDAGFVYINGQKVGESHDWQTPASFDVKKALHPGENTISVAVANYDGPGGINQGVTLRLIEKPAPVDWHRSVFNGWAEILVQATGDSGEIKLTATADGLTTAVMKLNAKPAAPRPTIAAVAN